MMPALAQLAGEFFKSYRVLSLILHTPVRRFYLLIFRGGNIVLLQFLVGLKQVTEDELVADLVVNILKASPDILSRYFKETRYSYTPRLKSAWQDNVKLLKKVLVPGIFD